MICFDGENPFTKADQVSSNKDLTVKPVEMIFMIFISTGF